MRISDCSSDVCSSDLVGLHNFAVEGEDDTLCFVPGPDQQRQISFNIAPGDQWRRDLANGHTYAERSELRQNGRMKKGVIYWNAFDFVVDNFRSEEHTSELQSLMRRSYAGVCLKKKNKLTNI